MLDHLLGDFEVGNHAVPEGPYGLNITGRTADHPVCFFADGKTKRQSSQTMRKGFAEEAKAFLDACRNGEAPVPVEALIETTLVTLLAVEDLAGAGAVQDK